MYCNGIDMCGTPTFSLVTYLLLAPWISQTQAQNSTTQPNTTATTPVTTVVTELDDETLTTMTTEMVTDLDDETVTTPVNASEGGLDDDFLRILPTTMVTELDAETGTTMATTMVTDLDAETFTTITTEMATAMVTETVTTPVNASEGGLDDDFLRILSDTDGDGATETQDGETVVPGGYGGGVPSGSISGAGDPSDDEKEIKEWIAAIVNKEAQEINVKIQEILAGNEELETDIKAMKEKVGMLENVPLKKCPVEYGTATEYSSVAGQVPATMAHGGYRRKKRQAYPRKSAPAYFSIYKTEPYFPDKSKVSCSVPFDGSNIHRSVSLDLTSGTVRIQQPGVYYLSFTCLKMTGYPIKVQITRNSEVIGSGQHSLGKVTLDNEELSTVLAQNNIWSSVYVEALVYLTMGDSVRVKMYNDGAIYDDRSRYTHFIGYKL